MPFACVSISFPAFSIGSSGNALYGLMGNNQAVISNINITTIKYFKRQYLHFYIEWI